MSPRQPPYEPSKRDHPYFQSGYVEKLVPSVEGVSQGNSQPETMTVVQRPHHSHTTQNVPQEQVLPHRPAVQKVASYAGDSVNLAKRRRTDDVDLQDHSFWQAEQRQQERPAPTSLNERDRQVKYINYSDIRQQVGETRLIPIKESHRPPLDSREQGNLASFSLNNQERVASRPTQPLEAHGQAPRISAAFAPNASYSSNSALQLSQADPRERLPVPQRLGRPVEYVHYGWQQPDPASSRPPEGHPLARWEDPHREVIVIDSPPEPQRSVRVVPFHDGAAPSTRNIPIRSLQTHENRYETRPVSYLQRPGGAEPRDRVVLQHGETLHRYHVGPEPTYPIRQAEKPLLVRQPENYMTPLRRDTTQDQIQRHYFAPQPQHSRSPHTDQDRLWYETGVWRLLRLSVPY